MSSKYEGFGNVLVEAAMFKVNVISSNCNSGPKEILLNGKGGQSFKVGDHLNYQKNYEIFKIKSKKHLEILYNSLERFSVKIILKLTKNYLVKFK